MTLTMSEAVEYAKEIIAADMEEAFQKEAVKAIGNHKTVFPPMRTGFLAGNILSRVKGGEVEFSFPHYAQYLEWGTGIYGPKERPITPKTKKALAWGKDLGGGKKEFVRKSVKGMTPAPFIRPVMHQQFIKIVTNALNEAFKDVYLNK